MNSDYKKCIAIYLKKEDRTSILNLTLTVPDGTNGIEI